jgi:hypothetical protein
VVDERRAAPKEGAMSWDPEIDDPATRPRPRLDGDGEGPVTDDKIDLGYRDAPPDLLAPIDPNAPVSGHRPPPGAGRTTAESPEQDWSRAQGIVFATVRAPGTPGIAIDALDRGALAEEGLKSHRQPLVAAGPADLVVTFVLPSYGFDVLVNADHLLDWAIEPDALASAAMSNLARWSGDAPWTSEEDERGRRIVSSATGDGWDAGRILLPEVRRHLATELSGGRILVGVPNRDLLVAARLAPDDAEFGTLFATFVGDQADGSDEPIDRRVFELVDDTLVPLPA